MESIISIAIIIGVIVILVEFIRDYKWRQKPLYNFPIKYRGKLLWYSRSVAVTLFTLCKNKDGKLCILVNRRGTGTPDFQGYWNAPCGYLDFNESGEKAAQRETYEETGIFIDTEKIKLNSVSSEPNENKRQNVTLRYLANIEDKTTDEFKFDTSHSEKNEVSDIKWIPLDEINNYQWAFNHKMLIEELVNKFNNN